LRGVGARIMAYSEEMLEVITAIQSASLDQDKWPLAFKGLADLTRSPAFNFCIVDGQRHIGVHAEFDGVPSDAMRDYCAGQLRQDPFITYANRMPLGATVHDYLHTQEDEIDDHPFYKWWREASGLRYGLGSKLCDSDGTNAYLTLHRAQKDGPATHEDISQFSLIMPHLLNGIEVSKRLTSIGAVEGSLTGIIDTLPRGLALIRKDGSVAFANEYLRRVLSSNDGLYMEACYLKAGRHMDQEALNKAIRLAISSRDARFARRGGQVVLARASGRNPYRVIATPLPRNVMFNLQPIAAMLFVIDPDEKIFCDSFTLMETLDLTEREAEIAVQLASGIDIAHIAEELGVSVTTARKHLQNIYKKAHVSRQGELVSLLCNIAVTTPRDTGLSNFNPYY